MQAATASPPRRTGRPLTIGQVCKLLTTEFADVSISKIRYLEDQELIAPRRTSGGYRLFDSEDVERLRTILRLQRDEFLPLRVIRQELAAGRGKEISLTDSPEAAEANESAAKHRLSAPTGPAYSLEQVCEQTRATPALVKELRDHKIIEGSVVDGAILFDGDEREIVRIAVDLARYGVGGRHIQFLQRSAGRESELLAQLMGSSLRSHNQARRTEAVDTLETLASTTTRLKHLMLIRDLRRLIP